MTTESECDATETDHPLQGWSFIIKLVPVTYILLILMFLVLCNSTSASVLWINFSHSGKSQKTMKLMFTQNPKIYLKLCVDTLDSFHLTFVVAEWMWFIAVQWSAPASFKAATIRTWKSSTKKTVCRVLSSTRSSYEFNEGCAIVAGSWIKLTSSYEESSFQSQTSFMASATIFQQCIQLFNSPRQFPYFSRSTAAFHCWTFYSETLAARNSNYNPNIDSEVWFVFRFFLYWKFKTEKFP